MARPKEEIQAKLKEQMDFLRSSVHAFYDGQFAESVRIATAIRVLVHESGMEQTSAEASPPRWS